MSKLTVQSSSHSYEIHVKEDIRFSIKDYLPKNYSSILIITDKHVAPLYLADVKKGLPNIDTYDVIIPPGEESKSFEYYIKLQTKAIELGLNRQSLIIALGGGVVGDIAGFVAATFMRGIDYIQVPTTILAHDSSVGGKVAINHDLGKNLIGSFYPPKAVIYDVSTLTSLSNYEVRSGYAELIKEALIADLNFFNDLVELDLAKITNKQLTDHLFSGIKVKATIVEADEKEAGERMFLNLGHTLAHAIESELGYGKLTHGEAVAIGLLFAIDVSEKHFKVDLRSKALLQWLQKNKYPLNIDTLSVSSLISRMKSDKKVVDQTIQMVLLEEIGKPIVIGIEDQHLEKYLKKFLGKLVDL